MPAPWQPTQPQSADELLAQILGLTAERSRIAEEEQQKAQQNLAMAEEAPAPGIDPLARSLATAGSRLATTLAGPGGPDYSKQQQQNIAGKEAKASTDRLANVTRLRATYEKAAERAAKIGDSEAEIKARVAMKKVDEQLAEAKATGDASEWTRQNEVKHKQDLELERLRGINRVNLKETPGALASAGGNEALNAVDNYANQVIAGQVDFTAVPVRGGMRDSVSSRIAEMGEVILPKKVREAVNEVGAALKTVEELRKASAAVNTEPPIVAGFTGMKKATQAWYGADLDAGALNDIREGLLGNLSRAVSAERGVLTEQDVRRIRKMMPDVFTPKDRAQDQLERLERFLESKIATARKAYAMKHTAGGGGVAGRSSTSAAGVDAGSSNAADPLGIR